MQQSHQKLRKQRFLDGEPRKLTSMTHGYHGTSNVDKPIIEPFAKSPYIGGINHSQMGGLWHCYSHII